MECEQAERARSVVRQGDVVAAHPGTTNWSNPWRRFFVVLSADCDITNNKLDNGLVVVPVIGLETYALDIWLPEQIRRQSAAVEKKVEPLVRRFPGWETNPLSVLSLSVEDLDAELNARTAGDDELEKPAKTLKAIHGGFQHLNAVKASLTSKASTLGAAVRVLCEAKSGITGNVVDPEKELKAGLASASDPKRTDFWPICDLIGMDGQMREDERDGFVAALRRFTQVPLESVFLNKAQWLGSPDSYLRICRLRGIYKTDFLHRFASLFTRVGLDAGRDDEHQRMFDVAAARALKSKESK